MVRRMGLMVGLMAALLAGAIPATAQTLYVSDGLNNRVLKVASDGSVSQFATTDSPRGLAFDRAGNLYVANYWSSTIVKFTPDGSSSVFATNLMRPLGLAFDAAGNLYAASTADTSIRRITPSGVSSVFASGESLSNPWGIAFDSAGNLYAVSEATGSISKVDPDGTLSLHRQGPRGYGTYGLATKSDELYAVGYNSETSITRLGASGEQEFDIPFQTPLSVAFDAQGNLYAGTIQHAIYRFNAAGERSTFATGTGIAEFMAFDTGPAVPEPSAALLFLPALGVVALVRKRRAA